MLSPAGYEDLVIFGFAEALCFDTRLGFVAQWSPFLHLTVVQHNGTMTNSMFTSKDTGYIYIFLHLTPSTSTRNSTIYMTYLTHTTPIQSYNFMITNN